MTLFLTIFGILTCVAVFIGFLWVLNFIFAPYDAEGADDWYSDDEGL